MTEGERFLIDKSAYARILNPVVLQHWREPLSKGMVAVCEPTEFEILCSARSHKEYGVVRDTLRALYGWEPVPDGAWRKVLALQEGMAREGHHRGAGAVDLLVAVTAQSRGMTVLHYDHDFETIAKHTDLKTHWLAEPGSLS
jgi:predicted nucleic acid-binding protein